MGYKNGLFSAILAVSSLSVEADVLSNLSEKFEAVKRKHALTDKDHFFVEVAIGGFEYKDQVLLIKDGVFKNQARLSAEYDVVLSKIESGGNIPIHDKRLATIEAEMERGKNLLASVVDHILNHAYSINSLTLELLLHCDVELELYEDYSLVLDRIAKIDRKRLIGVKSTESYIPSSDWAKYMSSLPQDPSKGLKCENIVFNARHAIDQAKSMPLRP